MATGNVYVVATGLDETAAKLNNDNFIKIPGTEGRDDFYINPLQVSAVYPARED
jgi:hypothetical protein